MVGKITVSPGASLRAEDAAVIGTISASGAQWIDLRGGGTGPLSVTGTTGHLSVSGMVVAGAAELTNNTTSAPIVVSGNTIVGLLSCTGNVPPPVNDGVPNRVVGLATGQCKGL